MNQPPTLDDFRLSTSILNFLVAGFQGVISYHTVLGKLKHPLFSEEELISAERVISKVAEALLDTYGGNPTFYCSWTEIESFEATSFIDSLEKLRSSLLAASRQLDSLLKCDFSPDHSDNAESLFAALTRRLMGTDTYLQEQLRTAIALGDSNLVATGESLIEALNPQLYELTEIGDNAFEKKLTVDDISILKKRTKDLPFIFAAQAHESRVLSRTYTTSSTFIDFDIPQKDGEKWLSQSIDPVTAGYFLAYGLDVEDMVAWADAKLFDAVEIFSWKRAGFLPHVAAEWKAVNFYPEDAILWMNADYKPEAARAEIDKGNFSPKRSSSFTTKVASAKPAEPSVAGINAEVKRSVSKGRAEQSSPNDTEKSSSKILNTGLNNAESGISLPNRTKTQREFIQQRFEKNKERPSSSSPDSNPPAQESVDSVKKPFKTRNTFTIKKPKP